MVGDFKCIELLLVLNLEQKGGRRVASYDDDNDDDRNRKNDKISRTKLSIIIQHLSWQL